MKIRSGLLLALVLASLSACTSRITGYAVVLWPEPDSVFSAGDILPITETSRLQDTITVIDRNDREHTLSTTGVSIFDEEAAAQTFREDFLEWSDTYARSLITALPIRSTADRSSTRLYRLRDGEVTKVLDREDEPSDVGGLTDYWYHVLTENGVTGWVFGRNLELVSAAGRPLEPQDDRDRVSRLVRDISEATWRPEYFRDMLRSGRINLERVSPRFGFFGDYEQQEFRLVMPRYRTTFDYHDYREVRTNSIRFEGADLTLELVGDERLRATFLLNDQERAETFILFSEDLDEIIAGEQDRRRQLLEEFTLRGDGLVSTAFGSLEIGDRGAVQWEDYDRLVPDVLPPRFDGTATIEFSHFIFDDLRSRYDGALALRTAGGETRAFLYTITDDGVRLVYVPQRLVSENNLVRSEPASPIVLFFRYFQP